MFYEAYKILIFMYRPRGMAVHGARELWLKPWRGARVAGGG